MQANDRMSIPRTVWALGLVSFFMDVSSETIHALLPLFLTTTLGASAAVVGLIDGAAEATAAFAKMFSGWISDRFNRRKPLILIGYGLGAVAKPLFALATAPALVFFARFADRIGKGLRGAPRDALIADVTPSTIQGRAFGLRQAMDTAGAFAGPLLAIAAMAALDDNFRLVFWIAVVPGLLSVACVVVGVEDIPRRREGEKEVGGPAPPIRLADLRGLDQAWWRVAGVGVVFTLARFSEAFLVLRAHQQGLAPALAPLVLVAMNAVYMVAAYPAGAYADHGDPRRLLRWGAAVLVAADLMLANGTGLAAAFAGIAAWGLHMALTQGLFAKLVADAAPESLRGSAFGLFNLVTGGALLAASIVAGLLWDTLGAPATFMAGASFAAVAGVASFALRPDGQSCEARR